MQDLRTDSASRLKIKLEAVPASRDISTTVQKLHQPLIFNFNSSQKFTPQAFMDSREFKVHVIW